jgi:hypothetical protein
VWCGGRGEVEPGWGLVGEKGGGLERARSCAAGSENSASGCSMGLHRVGLDSTAFQQAMMYVMCCGTKTGIVACKALSSVSRAVPFPLCPAGC